MPELLAAGDKPVYSQNGLLTTVAWGFDKKMTFALDGGVYITGAAVQWLRDKLHVISSSAETESMAIAAGDNGGVYFVPAFVGLAAPHLRIFYYKKNEILIIVYNTCLLFKLNF